MAGLGWSRSSITRVASKMPGGDGEYFYYSNYRAGSLEGLLQAQSGRVVRGRSCDRWRIYALDIYFSRATSIYVKTLYAFGGSGWNVVGFR